MSKRRVDGPEAAVVCLPSVPERHHMGELPRGSTGDSVGLGLLSLAHRVVAQNESLRPGLSGDDERILNSLCQFDALAALAVIDETGFVSGFLSDDAMRQAIFPKPDADLANALRGLDGAARQAALRFNGWDGYEDDQIREFLRNNPDPGSPA